MSRVAVVGLRPHYVIVPNLNTQYTTDLWRDLNSGVLMAINSTLIFRQAECWWNTGVIEFALTSVFLLKMLIKHGALFWFDQLRNQQMHAQFSLLFGLQYAMVILSKFSW